jgi:hypothetical protein
MVDFLPESLVYANFSGGFREITTIVATTPIIAMTTKSSTKVKPKENFGRKNFTTPLSITPKKLEVKKFYQ